MLQNILFSFGIILSAIFLTAIIISAIENEKRAALLFLFIGFLLAIPFFLISLLPFFKIVSIIIAIVLLVFFLLFILPLKGKLPKPTGNPASKIDERTTMFSRNELKTGTSFFNEYYNEHPEHKNPDDKFRKEPGLLSLKSKYADKYGFASAEASFSTVKYLAAGVDKKPASDKQKIDAESLSKYIKSWTKKLGALDTGITKLHDYHLYSIAGRGNRYGKSVHNDHPFAIAFTVKMDYKMMSAAPYAPTVMESAEQYLHSGKIAMQITHFIRELGYDARAHIDGNYELICPLVAKDAGLGEIGRIGLLITPKHGPRVRIAVVTTNVPLITDKVKRDLTVLDFCSYCKKCAVVCPNHAIPKTGRKKVSGTLRWRINSELCFTYWCQAGTDCGKCVISCPYAHPNNLLHNIIRTGIRRNFIFRYLAVKLDDLFYGEKPKSKKTPRWILKSKFN